ncbi:hypothetical protein GQ53DRAFT_657528 [Thozetella sp. PMI_491]|nr:hypothetical protein GQ53DRAFT_657528 [Thozetella sp. PMI_491]
MMMKTAIVALMGLAAVAEAGTLHQYRSPILESRQNRNGANRGGQQNAGGQQNNAGGNNNAASNTCLAANAVQTGSASTGQQNGVAADGQVNSATDTANFINFCSGQTLTNGLQNTAGSCNGIPMGKIPPKANMVSTVILNPTNGQNLQASKDFNVQIKVANLAAGSFTNATSTYYSAPQDLKGNQIVGHTHITIQDTGNTLSPTTPLDATKFAFFKGINDAGDGNGGLTATVTGGLPAGNYRVCTMSSASNHQPVLMPVAQRGAQDDCRYFTVGGNGGGNNAGNGGNTGNAATGNTGNAATGNTGNAATGNNGNKGNTSGAQSSAGTGNSASAAAQATTAKGGNAGATKATSAASKATSAAATTGNNKAGGAIGGIAAPAVADSGDKTRPFSVNGNTFVNKAAAVQRACAIQNNACADAVNAGKVQGSTVADCNAQETACTSAGGA